MGSFDLVINQKYAKMLATIWAMNNCEDIFIAKYNSSGEKTMDKQIVSSSKKSQSSRLILKKISISQDLPMELEGVNSGGMIFS